MSDRTPMLDGIRVLDLSRVIADVDVTDPTGFAEYRALVPATLEPYGGRFLIRGGAHDVAEGDWRPARGGV